MSNWAWRMGMFILMGVPAIVGGGLFYHLFENWTAVIIWEVLLLCIWSWIIAKGDQPAKAYDAGEAVKPAH